MRKRCGKESQNSRVKMGSGNWAGKHIILLTVSRTSPTMGNWSEAHIRGMGVLNRLNRDRNASSSIMMAYDKSGRAFHFGLSSCAMRRSRCGRVFETED